MTGTSIKNTNELEDVSSNDSTLEEGEITDDSVDFEDSKTLETVNEINTFKEDLKRDHGIKRKNPDNHNYRNGSSKLIKYSPIIVKCHHRRKKTRYRKCYDKGIDLDSEEDRRYVRRSYKMIKMNPLESIMTQISKAATPSRNYINHKSSSSLYLKKRDKSKNLYKDSCDVSSVELDKLSNHSSRDKIIIDVNVQQSPKFDFDRVREELLKKLKQPENGDDLSCVSMDTCYEDVQLTDDNKENEDNVIGDKDLTKDSMIPCTENVPVAVSNDSETEYEDDELIKLRLLALTSNKKNKSIKIQAVTEDVENLNHLSEGELPKSEEHLELQESKSEKVLNEEIIVEKIEYNEDDDETHQNEFSLRAEALKTALLKKHLKGKLKTVRNKLNGTIKMTDSETNINGNKILINLEKKNGLINNSTHQPIASKDNTNNSNVPSQVSSNEFRTGIGLQKNKMMKLNQQIVKHRNKIIENLNLAISRNRKSRPNKQLTVLKPKEEKFVIKLDEDSSDDEEDENLLKVEAHTKSDPVTEEKVDKLLQFARSAAPVLEKKIVPSTPDAVKHLPPSRRLEYIKLKQKIAEKEKKCVPLVKANTQESKTSTNRDPALKPNPNSTKTSEIHKTNMNKLKILLRGIKIEKQTEENYEKEIKKLKTQLNLLEKKKSIQRLKIENMVKQSKQIYRIMTKNNRQRQNKRNSECRKEDENITKTVKCVVDDMLGQVEKIENKNESFVVLSDKFDENLTTITATNYCCNDKQDLDMKESSALEAPSSKLEAVSCTNRYLMPYTSPLIHLSCSGDETVKIDPYVALCPFQLMGTCSDSECLYQHH